MFSTYASPEPARNDSHSAHSLRSPTAKVPAASSRNDAELLYRDANEAVIPVDLAAGGGVVVVKDRRFPPPPPPSPAPPPAAKPSSCIPLSIFSSVDANGNPSHDLESPSWYFWCLVLILLPRRWWWVGGLLRDREISCGFGGGRAGLYWSFNFLVFSLFLPLSLPLSLPPPTTPTMPPRTSPAQCNSPRRRRRGRFPPRRQRRP